MRAVKGNKVYTIDEQQKKFYQESGFDIIGDDGEIIEYGRGKTIPYGEYMKVKKELDELKASMETGTVKKGKGQTAEGGE